MSYEDWVECINTSVMYKDWKLDVVVQALATICDNWLENVDKLAVACS